MIQPVIYKTMFFFFHRSFYAATPIVSADNNVLYLEQFDCKLDD